MSEVNLMFHFKRGSLAVFLIWTMDAVVIGTHWISNLELRDIKTRWNKLDNNLGIHVLRSEIKNM